MKNPYTLLLVAAIHLLILPTAAFTQTGPACPVFNSYQIYGSCTRADTFQITDTVQDGRVVLDLTCLDSEPGRQGGWFYMSAERFGPDLDLVNIGMYAFSGPSGVNTIREEILSDDQFAACQQEIRDAACALYDASDPGDWIGIPKCQN